MIDRNKTLCFIGHRTEKLPKSKNEFNLMIQSLIYEINKAISEGYDTFMFGACYGFELICAEQVLIRKQIVRLTDPISINLVAVVPFEEQAAKWKEKDREKYFNALPKCDDVITLNKHYQSESYHERNRYMVDNSSRLICYYDGSSGGTRYTVEYAERQSIQIINLCNSYNDINLKDRKQKSLMRPIM
ncbi:SLOG family protein [Sedimentibacter sp.]|uniref:SLOG family protein n=1 Tax=Sedimentibacter sp. TaxID=1960295 RepID=UPI0028A7BF3C|nr:SLOG family protein [Sedimentibacter sp.]